MKASTSPQPHPPTQRGVVPPAAETPRKSPTGGFVVLFFLVALLVFSASLVSDHAAWIVGGVLILYIVLAIIPLTRRIAEVPLTLIFGPWLFRRQRIARIHEIEELESLPDHTVESQRQAFRQAEEDFRSRNEADFGHWAQCG